MSDSLLNASVSSSLFSWLFLERDPSVVLGRLKHSSPELLHRMAVDNLSELFVVMPTAMEAQTTYAVPATDVVTVEDHWFDVQDPKEKKRIQNRNAQRLYRQRVRARLKAYETTVKNQQAAAAAAAKENASEQASMTSSKRSPTPKSHYPSPPTATRRPYMPQPTDTATIQPQSLQLNFLDNTVVMPTNKTPELQPPMGPVDATQDRSSHQQNIRPDQLDENAKTSEKMLMDYLRTSKEMLNQAPNKQAPNQVPMPDDFIKPGVGSVNRTTSRPDQLNGTQPMFPREPGEMEDFTASIERWTTEMLPQSHRDSTSSGGSGHDDLMNNAFPQGVPRAPAAAPEASNGAPGPPQPPFKSGTPQENFELVLECAQAVGSESFDSLIIAYYTEKFWGGSSLANEQRLSRNRGLPKLISNVYQATSGWSEWERRGFHEEILKTTEMILMSEADDASQMFKSSLGPLLESQDWTNASDNAQFILTMQRMIEDKLPNLWALLMTLSGKDGESWQRSPSNTVLASIILLRYGGRIPNGQLLGLLGACL